MENSKSRFQNKGFVKILLHVLRGAMTGLLISIIGILIFAYILKAFNAPDSSIAAVNMVIELISILVAVMVTLKKVKEKGFLMGALTGIAYAVLGFIVFSILKGDFTMLANFWADLLTGFAAGTISGVLIMNLRKK